MRTISDLKDWIKDLPDDYEIWIEYPERYGFHSPMEFDNHIFDDQDFIQAICIGRDDKKRRLYIMHHY